MDRSYTIELEIGRSKFKWSFSIESNVTLLVHAPFIELLKVQDDGIGKAH